MADAGTPAPECKFGHGSMLLAATEDGRPIAYEQGVDRGFAFVGYKCPACSYLEFHALVVAPTGMSENANGAEAVGASHE